MSRRELKKAKLLMGLAATTIFFILYWLLMIHLGLGMLR